MTESILVLSVVGLFAGFVLSMPVAGPISILITSNALKGRLKYCRMATVGASIVDFFFIMLAVFGISKLYNLYRPFIPYILLAGAFFLCYTGYKIYGTDIESDYKSESKQVEKIKGEHRGGFFTGFMMSLLNPTLFLSWLASSFFIISFISALGFNMGGITQSMDEALREVKKTDGYAYTDSNYSYVKEAEAYAKKIGRENDNAAKPFPQYFPLVLSLCYAFFVALGSIAWFFLLTWLLGRHRHRVSMKLLSRTVRVLGIALCFFGIVLGYKGLRMFA